MSISFAKSTLSSALALTLVAACSQEAPQEDVSLAPQVRPAKLITVIGDDTARALVFPATVQADEFADLNFQVAGEIRQLNVLEGETVSRGEIIAALDPINATNEVARTRSEYENAKAAFERALLLVEENAIAQSVLEERRSNMQVTKAALDTAEEQLRDNVLRAPYAGRISQVYVRPFQVVQASNNIVLIQSTDLEAVFSLPSAMVAQIGDLNSIDARVRLNAAPDIAIDARFKEIAGDADPATQTYEAALRFTPPEGLRILPGMTAEVSLTLPGTNTHTTPVIPLTAIVSDPSDTFVWRVSPDTMQLASASVTLGTPEGGRVEILQGLEPGDLIVAAGAATFQEGVTVRPWSPR